MRRADSPPVAGKSPVHELLQELPTYLPEISSGRRASDANDFVDMLKGGIYSDRYSNLLLRDIDVYVDVFAYAQEGRQTEWTMLAPVRWWSGPQ
jgi:hypothetical protein